MQKYHNIRSLGRNLNAGIASETSVSTEQFLVFGRRIPKYELVSVKDALSVSKSYLNYLNYLRQYSFLQQFLHYADRQKIFF
jgi:hypothetical protein